MPDVDLFTMYRWLLAIICAVYTLLVTARTLHGWLTYFGSSRQTAILGRYAGLLLLRVRFWRLAWELVQITLWLVVFGCLLYLHHHLLHRT